MGAGTFDRYPARYSSGGLYRLTYLFPSKEISEIESGWGRGEYLDCLASLRGARNDEECSPRPQTLFWGGQEGLRRANGGDIDGDGELTALDIDHIIA